MSPEPIFPPNPKVFFFRDNQNQIFYTFSKETLIKNLSSRIYSSNSDIFIDFSGFSIEEKLKNSIDPLMREKKKEEETQEKTEAFLNNFKRTHLNDEKLYFLKTLNEKKNYPLNEKKNYPLNDKKNYPLNDKKNYPLNDNSLFIDLSNPNLDLLKRQSPDQRSQEQNQSQDQRSQDQISQDQRSQDPILWSLSSDHLQVFKKDPELRAKLNELTQKHGVSYEFNPFGIKVSTDSKDKKAIFSRAFNEFLSSFTIFKLKKNNEELPGIIAFFNLKPISGIRLLFRKFIDSKGQKKVDLYILAMKEMKEKALEIVQNLEKFYFFKEIMMTHKKGRPFDLRNKQEFKEIREEGHLINDFIKKSMQEDLFEINKDLKYEFIENLEKSKNPRFPYSMLFYWRKELRRSEIRSQISEIKRKIKEFLYISLIIKGDQQLEKVKALRGFLNNYREIAISEPKRLEDSEGCFSFGMIGKWRDVINIIKEKLGDRNNMEIKRFCVNKGKFERDEEYHMRVNALRQVCFGAAMKSVLEFDQENYVAFKIL